MVIEDFKDIHKGDRCFIIGTGPSLNNTNLNLIRDEILFGVNTFYKLDVPCTYYAVSDIYVWRTHKEDILHLPSQLFLSGHAAIDYARQRTPKFTFIKEPVILLEIGVDKFAKDVTNGLYNGQTIVYDICLQVAYYMGFNKIYLVGVDADYSGEHHFDGEKAGNLSGGVVGEWGRVFRAHKLAKKTFEEDGREILNATVGGNLEIYKRVNLEDIV